MKAVIIGAGRGSRLGPETSEIPKTLVTVMGRPMLDWILDALAAGGFTRRDIVFIGGYAEGAVRARYPDLAFVTNTGWADNNILLSLLTAREHLEGGFLSTYADIVYEGDIVQRLVASRARMTLGCDTAWRRRYVNRSQHPETDAEKLRAEGTRVVELSRKIPSESATGEFIGVMKLSPEGAGEFLDAFDRARAAYTGGPFREGRTFERAYLIDLLQHMLESGSEMHRVDTPGGYMELDTLEDLAAAEMVAHAMSKRIDPSGLVEHLARTRRPGLTGMAFDADGTLWDGDVGEDVFEYAYERGLFREEARSALLHVAKDHELLIADGSPSDLARRIYAAYRAGSIGDRLVCEVMTWGYAGFTLDELRSLARQSFEARGLASRMRPILAPVLEWAQREAIRVIVVSASPREIVVEALACVGLDTFAVAGAVQMDGGRILPAMSGPVPFADDKRIAGLSLLTGHDWLASFGDNSFDVDLLKAARVGVAVCPKPALVARLNEVNGVFVLG